MNKNLVAITAIAVAIWCAGGTGSAQTPSQAPAPQRYPHQLTSAELRATIPNSTAYAAGNFGPKTYASYRSADGHIHIKSPGFDDVGIYRITDDSLFCTKYNKIRGGQETCQTVWQTGPDSSEVHLPNGQVITGPAPVSGNPERL